MRQRYPIGKIGKLDITADASAAAGGLLLWAFLIAVGRRVFRLRPGAAMAGGLIATGLHFLSELWHQAGHARAAEETGYPMTGVHLWGVLGTSVYPRDEPEVSGEIHVARAMGGPRASARLAVTGGVLALLTWPLGGMAHMVAILFALENWLVFTLGAFIPLPFMETDGTILQRYRQNHRKRTLTISE